VRLALFFSLDLRDIAMLDLLRRHHAAQKIATDFRKSNLPSPTERSFSRKKRSKRQFYGKKTHTFCKIPTNPPSFGRFLYHAFS
jgi:hypothetical protein